MRDRVPVSGSFDLTYRCNLRCVHCYCGHLTAQTASQAAELSTAGVQRLLAEAAEAGLLSLVLSGGEPLLRSDFVTIYDGACRLGLLTTVFTNATLVDDHIVAALREYPPQMVEVSMYGATDAVYERVTGVRGSYVRAMRGIQRLMDAGVRVGLKSMVLRDNVEDIPAMLKIADELGVSFRSDALVTPRLDGDQGPLEQRVDPVRAAELELLAEKSRRDAAAYRDRRMAADESPDLYQCGAGSMGFHLDPAGGLRPCIMSQEYAFDAVGLGFAPAWKALVRALDGLRLQQDSLCPECNWRALCGYCPGLLALETGSVHGHSPYMCSLGERRSGIIGENLEAMSNE
ncbi:MAG: radical SAM protein [Actinomycetes bacterium]